MLGEARRPVVADQRRQRRDESDAVFQVEPATFAIGFDAADAAFGEQAYGIGEFFHCRQQVGGDERQESVQLELAALCGQRNRQIAGDGLVGDLGQHFRHDRVDFAGHDRGAGLQVGQADLAEPAARTRR